jgi:hypothetical protein
MRGYPRGVALSPEQIPDTFSRDGLTANRALTPREFPAGQVGRRGSPHSPRPGNRARGPITRLSRKARRPRANCSQGRSPSPRCSVRIELAIGRPISRDSSEPVSLSPRLGTSREGRATGIAGGLAPRNIERALTEHGLLDRYDASRAGWGVADDDAERRRTPVVRIRGRASAACARLRSRCGRR